MTENQAPQGTELEPEEVEALLEAATRDGVRVDRETRGVAIDKNVN